MLAQRLMCPLAPPGIRSLGVAEGSLRMAAGTASLPLTTLLLWSPIDRNVRVQKVFNGYLRITNENFLDAYENSNSTEFTNLANKVKEAVSPALGQGAPSLLSALALPPHPGREDTAPFPPRSLGCRWRGLPGTWEGGPGPQGEEAAQAWAGGVVAALWPAVSLLSFPQLKLLYSGVPSLGPYHKESAVTAFRWVLGRRLGGISTVCVCLGGRELADCGVMEPRGLAWGAGHQALFFPQLTASCCLPGRGHRRGVARVTWVNAGDTGECR